MREWLKRIEYVKTLSYVVYLSESRNKEIFISVGNNRTQITGDPIIKRMYINISIQIKKQTSGLTLMKCISKPCMLVLN